ncbi:YpdA family putative bacillithiol disulfide reductase [Mangrovimonas futianensis]|uniref:YpdA family putative bacillithiol disulfide reductase n=1 Tax=Mangrovimonas futianensis TaxID=2895523 RepID=UPI001E368CC7|nr:YpdA family putative bacillithiol disulfide reductase [Mangrovimonas futianensis]MCF1423082.1 YpdA family putative bacillithiol disulfide reductase [Mangrovimonas futianensis]
MKDVVIIGAGPIGIACALECKKKGWDYLVLDKGALTNSLFNYPLKMTFFSTSERLEIDNIPFMSTNPKPNRDEALEYYRRVVSNNDLTINLYEEVVNVKKQGLHFLIKTTKQDIQAKNVIVATGFYDIPKLLNVPGENLDKVAHYYKEAHPFSMQKVAVIGASNSSVDAALEIWRKGGDVTMIIRKNQIGERVKYWVRPDILNRIEEGSIKVFYNSEITEIKEKEIIINTPTGLKTLNNDYVLALTGYQPNFEFLKNLGIQLQKDNHDIPVYNSETMESNVKGIYLAGVICGGKETHKWFIENSIIHAKMIANNLSKTLKEV